jgi:hypothetical protein
MLDLRKGSNTRAMVSGFLQALHTQPPASISAFYDRSRYSVVALAELLQAEAGLEELLGRLRLLNQEYRKFLQEYS